MLAHVVQLQKATESTKSMQMSAFLAELALVLAQLVRLLRNNPYISKTELHLQLRYCYFNAMRKN
jgi:hypothetical protein